MQTELISIKFQNFMSYGADGAELNFQYKEPVLVIGSNLDSSSEGSIDSNGAGKTTILNAVSYLLFDKIINPKVSKTSIINRFNKKDLLVEGVIKVNQKYYKIQRFRKNKVMGGDGIRILLSDSSCFSDVESYKDITPDSMAAANKFIAENIINMPFDVFSRVAVYSAKHQPFLSLPSSSESEANQRDILEEVFGLTDLTRRAENLKKLIATNKSDLERKTELNEIITKANKQRLERIQNLTEKVQTWSNENAKAITDLSNRLNLIPDVEDIDTSHLMSSISERTSKIDEISKKILAIESENSRLLNLKKTLQNDISNLSSSRDMMSNQLNSVKDFDEEIQIKNLNSISSLSKELEELKLVKTSINNKIIKIESDIKVLEDEIDHLKSDNCPYCKQHFADASIKMQDNELKIVEISSTLQEFTNQHDLVDDAITKLNKSLDKLKNETIFSSISELQNNIKSRNNFISNIKDLEEKILHKDEQLLDINKSIENLDNSLLINLIAQKKELAEELNILKNKMHEVTKNLSLIEDKKEIQSKISHLKNSTNPYTALLEQEVKTEEQESYTAQINDLDKLLKHQQFLYKVLTKKDSFVRKAILKRNLPLLNERLTEYLNDMKLVHKVQFMEDMSVKISLFDNELSYDEMSSGQQARINIALTFAFRDVLQFRTGKFSFCMLDECLDTGLSNVGVQNAVKLIKKIAKAQDLNMLVISHRDEVHSMFKETIHIELKNGFSKIKAA